MMSTSYALTEGGKSAPPGLAALELFDRFETEGRVTVPNETVVYLGSAEDAAFIHGLRKGKASFSSGTEDDDGKDGNDCQDDNDGGNITFLWTRQSPFLVERGKIPPLPHSGKVMEPG